MCIRHEGSWYTPSVQGKMSMYSIGTYIAHEFECSGTIAFHWCTKNQRIKWVCVHGIDLALRLVLNCVGSGMGRSPIESHSVK